MKRNIAWVAIWVTLLSESVVHGQWQQYGPPQRSPYQNPGAYWPGANVPPQMPVGTGTGFPPGQPAYPGSAPTSKWQWQDRTFKPYEQFVLPVQAIATQPPQTVLQPIPVPVENGDAGFIAQEMGGLPTGNLPPRIVRNPLEAPDTSVIKNMQRDDREKYSIDRGGERSRLFPNLDAPLSADATYRNWLLNTLWKLNFDGWPVIPYRTWIAADYLRMKYKNSAVGVPLVTANSDTTSIGALNEPGTAILFGDGADPSINFGTVSGWRVTAGTWLKTTMPHAIEVSGFWMDRRERMFEASSPGGTAPLVSVPFFATQPFNFINPGGETALTANGAPNRVNVTLTSHLWGAEVNVIMDPQAEPPGFLRIMPLLGFRHLDLLENLSLTDTFIDQANGGTLVVSDGFGTRNQYYGAQLGFRASLDLGRWFIDTNARIALGINHQTLNIEGATTVNNSAFSFPNGATPGGVFAQPSNIGSLRRDVFAYVPDGEIKLGYELTQGIRLSFAYQFLYMSTVVRPGQQLDRNINPTQNAFFAAPPTVGPLAPLPNFRSTDFWAHGINVGIECRY